MLRFLLVSFIICMLAFAGCSTVTMQSAPGVAVKCKIMQPAPGSVTCADADGKTFVWTTDQSIKINGVCPPLADGTCPTQP